MKSIVVRTNCFIIIALLSGIESGSCGCFNHPADTAKKSETSTKLRFKLSRSRFSLLMKQEIVNAGYMQKATALLLNPIALPEDRNSF